MIAISSFRKHVGVRCQYRANQIRAKATWERVFDKIIYFGDEEKTLWSEKTWFIPSPNFPRIRDMASEAGRQEADFVAIINADIVVTKLLLEIPKIMVASNMKAVTSRRRDLKTKELLPDDKGRDIFIARPWVWEKVARNIPENCRIGHQQWDSWMVAFCRHYLKNQYGEFTAIPCIYHPQHTGRRMPYADEIDISHSKFQITFRNDPQLVLS